MKRCLVPNMLSKIPEKQMPLHQNGDPYEEQEDISLLRENSKSSSMSSFRRLQSGTVSFKEET